MPSFETTGSREASDHKSLRLRNLDPEHWTLKYDGRGRWGTFDANSTGIIQHPFFGSFSKDRVSTIDINEVFALMDEIDHLGEKRMNRAAGFPVSGEVASDDEMFDLYRRFRSDIGALHNQLQIEIAHDTLLAHEVLQSFWKCLRHSVGSKDLAPAKYFAICGTPTRGYGHLITRLANLGETNEMQAKLASEFGFSTWQDFVRRVWKTKDDLIEWEREYREVSLVIAQVGMGFGGMLLGLIGLALSIVIWLASLAGLAGA